ncbi:MAG: YdcF family protein [Rhodobacterales bacterium]|nr:YdcF family protein [Rhodobacterales bacterium]
MFLLKKILTALILPPTGPVLLALFGLWLSRRNSRRWQYAGLALATISLLGLIALAMPVVGNALAPAEAPQAPISAEALRRAQAIVILGGGSYYAAPEYGSDTVGSASLVRARYGAKLARETGLPVLVTSGSPHGGRAEAESMREVLEREFGVKVRWTETASRDTAENASMSAPLLKGAGITRIALVTHASHMPRSAELFRREGIEVLPAPTGFRTASPSSVEDYLPRNLRPAREALHEHLGLLHHRLMEKLP